MQCPTGVLKGFPKRNSILLDNKQVSPWEDDDTPGNVKKPRPQSNVTRQETLTFGVIGQREYPSCELEDCK